MQNDARMAEKEAATGGPGRGIEMHIGTLKVGPVAFRGRIVEGEKELVALADGRNDEIQKHVGDGLVLASNGRKIVFIGTEVGSNVDGPPLGGTGAVTSREGDSE